MDGEMSSDPRVRTRKSIRQAFAAVLASAAVVGGIVAVSGSDDERSVALAPTTVAMTAPPFVAPSLAPGSTIVTSPSDTVAVPTESVAPPAVVTVPSSTDTVAPVVIDAATTVPATAATGTLAPAASGEIPTATDAPAVNATAYAVYDSTNGRWLAGNQADAPLPVGSVMKLLTSYVVMQAGDPTKVVTVPKLEVDISESSIGLYEGEQLPRDVLFRAMIIVSANDAARTLALDIGGTTEGFVAMMNNAAAQLGLTNTVAANPIGLDAPGAHSSARDVIDVATLLMQDETFREAVAKPTARLHGQVFSSTNRLLTTYDGADGIKTGHTTQAGYCLVGSATRNGRRIIVAVLGAPSEDQRFADAAALLDWGFAQP
jgi:D-alanyl-D-alanine carboxypeptidase (penicillin-binding protein 5/6)